MIIKILISTFTTGENTKADNKVFGNNVKAAVESEYPGANVSIGFDDTVTRTQVFADSGEDYIIEKIGAIINRVWNS